MAANLPALGTPNPYDTSNIIKGTPTLQHINIGERTPLSPAMFTVLVMVLLYYSLSVLVLYYNSKEKEITEAGRLRRGQAITSQGIILMLAFLVMLVRIRLRVDYEASEPNALVTSTFSAIAVLSYLQSFTGDVLFCTDNKYIRIGRIVIRCICTAGLYTCVVLMFYCLLTQSKTANAHVMKL